MLTRVRTRGADSARTGKVLPRLGFGTAPLALVIPRLTNLDALSATPAIDFFSDDFYRAFRQRSQERAPIWLCHNSVIQNDHHSVVCFGPNQPADSLTKFQNRFR